LVAVPLYGNTAEGYIFGAKQIEAVSGPNVMTPYI